MPEGSGTSVFESYEVTKNPTIVGWFIISTLYGNKDRRGEPRMSMAATLDRIAALVAAPASQSSLGGSVSRGAARRRSPPGTRRGP